MTPAAATSDFEERYKQVMMTNAQLDNDKQKLTYEVDMLKDQLADSQELTIQLQLDLTHTSRVCLCLSHCYSIARDRLSDHRCDLCVCVSRHDVCLSVLSRSQF